MTEPCCPRCQIELKKTDLGQLCPRCEGCWLGFDQLTVALKLSESELQSSEIAATLYFREPGVCLRPPVDCPVCGARCRRHLYLQKSEVVVDTCQTHGMWLDDGELAKIREYLAALEDPDPHRKHLVARVNYLRRLVAWKKRRQQDSETEEPT